VVQKNGRREDHGKTVGTKKSALANDMQERGSKFVGGGGGRLSAKKGVLKKVAKNRKKSVNWGNIDKKKRKKGTRQAASGWNLREKKNWTPKLRQPTKRKALVKVKKKTTGPPGGFKVNNRFNKKPGGTHVNRETVNLRPKKKENG